MGSQSGLSEEERAKNRSQAQPFGDILGRKAENTFQIAAQNINHLLPTWYRFKNRQLHTVMVDWEIDVMCISEVGRNWW